MEGESGDRSRRVMRAVPLNAPGCAQAQHDLKRHEPHRLESPRDQGAGVIAAAASAASAASAAAGKGSVLRCGARGTRGTAAAARVAAEATEAEAAEAENRAGRGAGRAARKRRRRSIAAGIAEGLAGETLTAVREAAAPVGARDHREVAHGFLVHRQLRHHRGLDVRRVAGRRGVVAREVHLQADVDDHRVARGRWRRGEA